MKPLFAGRLVVRLTPDDVGKRVTLRRRLPDGRFTDVVGVLETWQDGILSVRRRSGEVVNVMESTLVAGKVVS